MKLVMVFCVVTPCWITGCGSIGVADETRF